jgi:3-phosphoshikimate 1-carboxyvinyltransferase
MICAALAQGVSLIENASDSEDSALMANGLNQLGVLVRRDGTRWYVHGTGGSLYAPKFPIPVGNAGTTLRFLLSLAALAHGTVVFEGNPRMAERPNEELINSLRQAGVKASQTPGAAQYEVVGGGVDGCRIVVQQDRSSQFLSSLLLVAPYARGDITIEVRGSAISQSYVQMTLAVMGLFGVTPELRDGIYTIRAPQCYHPSQYSVEADASSASYGLASAAIAGGEVMVEGIRQNSIQGDARFAEILMAMGCVVQNDESGMRISREGDLLGISADMNAMPDIVPTLAAVALFAAGPSRIRNVAHLRFKESDRLEALGSELRKLGANIEIHNDGIEIIPAPLHGTLLDTHEDHRLAMSFALIGLRVPGVRIENPDCVRKSFPEFWKEFDRLS